MKTLTKRISTAILITLASISAYARSFLPTTFNENLSAVELDMVTMIGGLVGLLLIVVGWRYFKKSAS